MVKTLLRLSTLLFGLCTCSSGSVATPPEVQATPAVPVSACGVAPEPDCPLQGWMRGTAASAMASESPAALGLVFDRLQTFAPTGYADWQAIANAGSTAARAGDIEGCRRACKACHAGHRERYRARDRGRPLP